MHNIVAVPTEIRTYAAFIAFFILRMDGYRFRLSSPTRTDNSCSASPDEKSLGL